MLNVLLVSALTALVFVVNVEPAYAQENILEGVARDLVLDEKYIIFPVADDFMGKRPHFVPSGLSLSSWTASLPFVLIVRFQAKMRSILRNCVPNCTSLQGGVGIIKAGLE
jgi:hypothetical protein